MTKHCRELSADGSIGIFGGKASNLARVEQAGFRVPSTVVVGSGALHVFLAHNGFTALVSDYLSRVSQAGLSAGDEQYRQLVGKIQESELPNELESEIREAAEKTLRRSSFGLAVRSSAVCEDSDRASFAGVFESFVGVMSTDEALTKVVACWCSAWSPKAVRYVVRMGLEPSIHGMAVMMQNVVPATSSGVIYTADPATGSPWEFVMQATRGLSIDLMSGSGVGDTYRADWETGAIIEKEIVSKPTAMNATTDGVQTTDNRTGRADEPALSDVEAEGIARIARALDEAFDKRLDIEWALTSDGPWIVQARPMTALPAFFPTQLTEDRKNQAWQPVMVVLPLRADHPPNFVTPLYSHYSESEMWYRYQPEDIVLTGIWKTELTVNGYRFCEPGAGPTFQDYFEGPGQYESWLEKNEPRYRPRWDNHANEIRQLADSARKGLTETTTAAELIPVMLDVMDRLWDLNSFGWSGPQALGWMCEAALRHFLEEYGVEMDLFSILCGGTDSYTYHMTKSQQELGRSIHEPEVVDAFERLALGEIVPHLAAASPKSGFVRDFEAFCWRFGKTPPSWRGRPALWSFGVDDVQPISAIKNALIGKSRDVRKLHAESLKTRQANEEEIRSAISNHGTSALERFDRILGWARYWTQALNDRHGLTAGLLWEREIVWHTGTRLHREGLLERPEDLLLLERTDVESFSKTGDRRALTDAYIRGLRAYQRNRRLAPPTGIGTPQQNGDAETESDSEADSVQRDSQDDPLAGRGFGGGSVTGKARLIVNLFDPAVLESLCDEDVMVLPHELAFHYADWHSLLTIVKGVVSPGRPSHHLAQVARECGVPLIGEVKGDLGAISDGASIRIDGTTGTIEIE